MRLIKSNYYDQEPNFSVQVYKVKGESAKHILLIIHNLE